MDKWTTVPASVPKTISPFLARAKELIARDPVVAYWCKFKAAQIALDRIPADNEGREFLGDLMDDLESSKAALAENELVTNDAAGSAYVYNFASRVFDSADATDRDGKATRLTAKEFLAASVFYDVLTIFGPLETEVSEKITYAKWKATSIAKAFREGKVPTPGPANAEPPLLPAAAAATVAADAHLDAATHDAADTDAAERDEVSRQLLPRQRDEEEFSLPSAPADFATDQGADEERPSLPGVPDDMPTSSKDTYDLPSTSELDIPPPANHLPSAPPADDIPARPSQAQPPPQPPSLPPQQPSAPELPSRPLPLPKPSAPPSAPAPLASASDEWQPAPANLDPTAIAASQKHAKWAISALNYEDVETAKKELRLALQLIGG